MLYQVDPGPACLAPVIFGIRGITIGLSTVGLVAEDFGRRRSSSKFAMRGNPLRPVVHIEPRALLNLAVENGAVGLRAPPFVSGSDVRRGGDPLLHSRMRGP